MTAEEYLHLLNHTIDASLAATLAGLAFAIAALLYSVSSSLDAKVLMARSIDLEPRTSDVSERDAMRKASKLAVTSSYCFFVFLLTETLASPIPQGVAPPLTITFADGFSVASAAAAGGAGLVLLFRSARLIKRAL